jgi:hypothetical protein
MVFRILKVFIIIVLFAASQSGCVLMRQNAKYNFNDGLYKTSRFSREKVYVLKVEGDEDTIAVFPVLQFGDSTVILTKKRVNYTNLQHRLRDNAASRSFYKPSFDIDLMTMPVKYRSSVDGFPNQLTTNFNGALYAGYRIDGYTLKYKRTPLNNYKQSVKHHGYSAGLYAGIGNTPADPSTIINPNLNIQYEGMLLITGIAANVAVENLSFGISFGTDYLMDKYHEDWIYQGKPCIGFTLGLNIN